MIRSILAALLVVLPAHLWADATVAARLAPGQPPMVIAHRSADLGDAPENTLAWIATAIEWGVDMVHLNPQQTRDDRYVLMHDSTLNRTTDVETIFPDGPPGGPTRAERWGKDYVRDYTLDEIRRLTVTAPSGAAHRVPTLDEALELTAGKTLVVLGLKTYEIDSLAGALAGLDTRHVLIMDLYVRGTDQSRLSETATATGLDVAVALFGAQDHLTALEFLSAQIGPRLRMLIGDARRVTPAFVARADELDVRIVVSGWDGPEDFALLDKDDPGPWRAVIDAGYSAMTDQPDRLLTAIGR